jgi:N-acetylglucosaminylphosphatidylinositol deacetylase
VIAHPDDEAMFFAPTVLALTKPELGNHLKILCLSTGDADGLGETRKKELQKSALELGLRDPSDVFIVHDLNRFPDGMDQSWDEEDVASLLASAFAPDMAASQKASAKAKAKGIGSGDKAPTATIDVILTFDAHGISNHPNHRSLYHGAVHFLRTLMKDKAGFTCPVTLYTLTSTSIFRKYVGVLDAPLTMLLGVWSNLLASMSGSKAKDVAASGVGPARLLFVSSISDWIVAQSAMVKCHQSQMVWFRWGWITIGRYMTVNDLKRERV